MKSTRVAALDCQREWRSTPGLDNLVDFIEAAIKRRDEEWKELASQTLDDTEYEYLTRLARQVAK